MEDRQANSAAAAASSSSSSSRMRQMSGSAASADGSVSNSATRGGGQATAAATTAASTSEGDDAAQSGAAALTKEELALEDRRRRNRETQRAIRKRKATRLQESEVKVVLQEGEMQRLRSMLESVEQENAVLREKLAHCTCGPHHQHQYQQSGKPKIGMGRTLIVDGLQGVAAAAAAAAAAQEDDEKTPVLPAYPATASSSSFAFHFPQRAPEPHISHVHGAPPHVDDHREPEGNAASSSGSGSSGTVLETRRPSPPRRRRRLSSSSAAVAADEHMQATALEDDRFSSSSSTSSRHRDGTSVLGKRKPSIALAGAEENLGGEFAFPVTRGHPRSGPPAQASPLSASGARPRPSVLQGPLSYENVVPTAPGSTASSTTTVLASLPSRDLTRTSTISTTATSRSSNPTSSSSSIPTRTSSQSSYPPSSVRRCAMYNCTLILSS